MDRQLGNLSELQQPLNTQIIITSPSRNNLQQFSPQTENIVNTNELSPGMSPHMKQGNINDSNSFGVSEELPKERFLLPDLEFKDKNKSHLMIYDDDIDNSRQFGVKNLKSSLQQYFLKKLEEEQQNKEQITQDNDSQNYSQIVQTTHSPIQKQKQLVRRSTIDYSKFKIQKQISTDQNVVQDDQVSFQNSSVRKHSINEHDLNQSESNFENQKMQISPEMIEDYYGSHPLNEIEPDVWNNIPVCIVKAFKILIEHFKSRDLDNWEKKAQINEQFFKLQHIIKKVEGTFDGRIMAIEESSSAIKKILTVENQRNQDQIRKNQGDILEIKGIISKQGVQLKQDLENEKVNIFKMLDKLRKDLMDSFLIVTENTYEGDNLTVTKKNIRHYTIEKVDELKKFIEETKNNLMNDFKSSLKSERELIEKQANLNDQNIKKELTQFKTKFDNKSNIDFDKFRDLQKDTKELQLQLQKSNDELAFMKDQEFDIQVKLARESIAELQKNFSLNIAQLTTINNQSQSEIANLNKKINSLDSTKMQQDINDIQEKLKKLINPQEYNKQDSGVSSHLDNKRSMGAASPRISIKSPANKNKQSAAMINNSLLSPASPRITSQNFTNKMLLANQQSFQVHKQLTQQKIDKEDNQTSQTSTLDKQQIEEMIKDSIEKQIKIIEQTLKLDLKQEIDTQIKTQRTTILSPQIQSRLFSAAHKQDASGKISNRSNIRDTSQQSNNLLSPRNMVESFDDFKEMIKEESQSKKSIQEWFMKQMRLMQMQSRQMTTMNDLNGQQSFTSQASFVRGSRYNMLNSQNKSRSPQKKLINPELNKYMNDLQVYGTDQKIKEIKESQQNKSSYSTRKEQSTNIDFINRYHTTQNNNTQSGINHTFMNTEREDQSSSRLESLYNVKYERYDQMVNKLDQSVNLKQNPILSQSIERTQNVKQLLQSFTTSPKNLMKYQESAELNITMPNALSLRTYDFNLDSQKNNSRVHQKFFEKRPINTATYEPHDRNKKRKMIINKIQSKKQNDFMLEKQNIQDFNKPIGVLFQPL
eukprot:403350668